MMHHPNMHHQPMSGHPPQHMGGHQTMPTHHQMPPHQLHRENRHVTLTRVPLGPSQAAGGMSAHGQAMGGMGAMGVPPHHGPTQRPPHPIRAMPHHPPGQHHSIPPQQMKPLRRPYMAGGYGPGNNVVPGPFPQPRHHQPMQSNQSGQPAPMQHARLCRSSSPSIFSTPTKLGSDFAMSTLPSTVTTNTNTNVPEASVNATANVNVAPNVNTSTTVNTNVSESNGGNMASGDGEAARPTSVQANSKEKTPMCLVNELARYNKIKHQYRLTSETGPAHKKVFTVTLRLGDTEEYTAEGSSIKRAQHAAASSALSGTGYPPPPPRALSQHPSTHPHHRHSVMPTVELNALAMKLCQPAVYTSIPAVANGRGGGGGIGVTGGRGYRGAFHPGMYPPRLVAAAGALVYRVRVAVGGRAWLGEGATPQAARHDAAARALRDLRPPPPDPRSPQPPAATPHADSPPADLDAGEADLLNSEVKSPVSLVHELALKRNLSVQFAVKSERGPPHMRVFVTVCSVGELETEGEGNGKKVSKRRAAEHMLEEMRRRWPAAVLRARVTADPRRRTHPAKKKPRNLVKESVETGGGGAGGGASGGGCENPISRLAVARHAARARSPQYRVVEERGAARRREFLVQCDAPPHSATGLGPNKKIAKRRAAHNVLLSMEKSMNANQPTIPTNTNSDVNSLTATTDSNKLNSSENKPKDIENEGGEARQPVPGVLLMDYHQRTHPTQHNGVSETNVPTGNTPGAKDQLMYLSQLLGFTVQFSDFPKRNHGEYLSLVSVSTEPPVLCHGGGASTAHSHEQCSRAALRALALMGLDAPSTPAPATLTAAPAHAPTTTGIQNISVSGSKGIISNGITE